MRRADGAGKERATYIDRPWRFAECLPQPFEAAVLAAPQMIETRVQAVEAVVVGRREAYARSRFEVQTPACVLTHAGEDKVPDESRNISHYCRLPATAMVWPVM